VNVNELKAFQQQQVVRCGLRALGRHAEANIYIYYEMLTFLARNAFVRTNRRAVLLS